METRKIIVPQVLGSCDHCYTVQKLLSLMKYHFSVFVLFPVFGGSDPEKSLPIPMTRSEFLMFSHFLKKVLFVQKAKLERKQRTQRHLASIDHNSWKLDHSESRNPGTFSRSPTWCRAQPLVLFSAAFQVTLAGNWISTSQDTTQCQSHVFMSIPCL